MKKVLKNNKGFTLIELIVVLVVLTILMCLTAPSVFGYSRKAQETAAIEECKGVVSAVIDIFSDQYVNTGRRISQPNEALVVTDGVDCYDHPIVEEARKMAGVDGKVNGAWIRGNSDYILSHLVYEWSNNLWVVYDEGEYRIYKGESDTPAEDKKKGNKPLDKPANPPTHDYTDDGEDEESTEPPHMETPTEAETETATEAKEEENQPPTEAPQPPTEAPQPNTENKSETLTDSDGNEHTFSDPDGLWEQIKDWSQKVNKEDGSYSTKGTAEQLHFVMGQVYSDSSGVYVCVNANYSLNFMHGLEAIPMDMTIEEYRQLDPEHAGWLVKVDPNTLNLFTETDLIRDKKATVPIPPIDGVWLEHFNSEYDYAFYYNDSNGQPQKVNMWGSGDNWTYVDPFADSYTQVSIPFSMHNSNRVKVNKGDIKFDGSKYYVWSGESTDVNLTKPDWNGCCYLKDYWSRVGGTGNFVEVIM